MANRLTDEERRQFAETGFLCIHDALPVRTTPRDRWLLRGTADHHSSSYAGHYAPSLSPRALTAA